MKLFFRKFGEGDPLIILHGVFGSSDNWQTIAKRLAANNSVYIVDARNHGLSPHSDVFNFTSMSDDLLELMEDNNIINPILIGHSMGGKTAMTFANLHPEKINKIVVVDIGPKAYPVHHSKIFEALFSINLNEIISRQDAEIKLSNLIKDTPTRQFLLKNLYRKNDTDFAWRFNLQVLNDNIENIGISQLNNPSFTKPVLFIRGENSNYILNEDWSDILKVFPNATLCTVKDSGHWVHAENPDGFISCLERFLA
jgi:pimeloyl-ACP methyl ester carboxylesterase